MFGEIHNAIHNIGDTQSTIPRDPKHTTIACLKQYIELSICYFLGDNGGIMGSGKFSPTTTGSETCVF